MELFSVSWILSMCPLVDKLVTLPQPSSISFKVQGPFLSTADDVSA